MIVRTFLFVTLSWGSLALAQTSPPGEPATPEGETPSSAPTDGDKAEALPPPAGDAASTAPPEPAPIPPEAPALPAEIELPSPAPAALPEEADAGEEISLEQWDRDDWMLVKPKVSMVDLDGYLRFRTDLFRKLDFNNGAIWEDEPRYLQSSGSKGEPKADYTGANFRLRIEPQINVTESIHVVTTFDILDNLVLGSTPTSVPSESATPSNLQAGGQRPPENGWNAVTDSIVIKRAYGRVTALNEKLELAFGRMPDHWGLGMMANSGDCLDCDYGDVVDRLSLSFKAAGFIFAPMYDWVSSGPIRPAFGRRGGQPLDAATWDDVEQYSIRVAHLDHPEDIKKKTANDELVANYGLWAIYRRQNRDLNDAYYQQPDPDSDEEGATIQVYDPARPVDIKEHEERRDARIITGDAFAILYYGNLQLAFEGAIVWGEFRDRLVPTQDDLDAADPGDDDPEVSEPRKNDILQYGAAAELKVRLEGDYAGTGLSLKTGFASGDSAPGFGALDKAHTQRGVFGTEGHKVPDRALNNFQFSPDYHLDLLMFRRIVGTVTDAWYVRPEVSYMFDERVNGRLSAIYSQALFKRSTASCYSESEERCRSVKEGAGARAMGLEFDAELAYGIIESQDGGAFRAALAGGILFPFGAFKNPDLEKDQQGGSFAWTLQTRLYIAF